ncbi:MAG: YggS family pyridoxal phosphate-dependent enzyme [Lentisphaerae bacterium]|nr:YggS family pyridoxal phosphate-dependent enzyme [Lentisphaerota bacterium]
MDRIGVNLLSVLDQIRQACSRSGRPAEAVKLLAVSKTFPLECVLQAHAAGQLLFGENRVQELVEKAPLAPPDCEWHLIGHLQRNKVRAALRCAACIQSVDSLALLHRINNIAAELQCRPAILLEVNISGEASKFGLPPEEVEEVVLAARDGQARCQGLMTVAPLAATPAELGKIFAGLRQLRDKVSAQTGCPLPELSMGMSGDFPIAIAEGATIVRIGSAIFGAR